MAKGNDPAEDVSSGADPRRLEQLPTNEGGSRASSARVWNAALGGKDTRRADRELLAAIEEFAPQFSALAKASQQFLFRACAYLTSERGITQYIDFGPGYPVRGHVHDIVQALNPATRVLYIDNAPGVLAHARALLAINRRTCVIPGDLLAPQELLADETVTSFLDWTQPIAMIHTATLHHQPVPTADLVRILQTYIDAAAPGSCTVISHFLAPDEPAELEAVRQIEKQFVASAISAATFRTLDEIRELFPGQELLQPGIVPCHQWPHLDTDDETDDARLWIQGCIAGGVGRKPTRTKNL